VTVETATVRVRQGGKQQNAITVISHFTTIPARLLEIYAIVPINYNILYCSPLFLYT